MSSLADLKAEAKALGLRGYSTLRKHELRELLEKRKKPAPAPAPMKVKRVKKPLAERKHFKAGLAKTKEALAKGVVKSAVERAVAKYKEKKAEARDPTNKLNKDIDDYIKSHAYIPFYGLIHDKFVGEIDDVKSWMRHNIGTGADEDWYDDWKDELKNKVEEHNKKYPKEVAKAKKTVEYKTKAYDDIALKLSKFSENYPAFKKAIEYLERITQRGLYQVLTQKKYMYESEANEWIDTHYPNIKEMLKGAHEKYNRGLTPDTDEFLNNINYGLSEMTDKARTKPMKELVQKIAKLIGNTRFA
jgi:hypothetical protein